MQFSNNMKTILATVFLISAAIIAYFSFFRGDPADSVSITLLCSKCNATYSMTHGKYQDLITDNGQNSAPGDFTLPCKECGQKAAQVAVKCSKCSTVFFPMTVSATAPDKCPKCGFSKAEQLRSNHKH
ncbi:MAG: hypothetical protein A2Y12_18485 [Planctomycetes bacterium GWF2_42_9]|nr:MAG: hypothetical protein A2Y12_18485 [Planctomycetes bacterium GWF2_42_9]